MSLYNFLLHLSSGPIPSTPDRKLLRQSHRPDGVALLIIRLASSLLDIVQLAQSNGNINQTTTASQTYDLQQFASQGGTPTFTGLLTNAAEHQDTLVFNSSGQLVNSMNQSSAQLYNAIDSTGVNYFCTVTAANNALTAFAKTCSK